MFVPRSTVLALVALLVTASGAVSAQQLAATPAPPPEVGSMAPDFALPAATRYGLLRDSIRLSDLRGKTVVIAFFYKARTKG
jgi:peroxiredoxin Q/BCP